MKITYKGKATREKLGLSLRDVEADTHISKGTICKWETGKAIPDFYTLATIAEYYETDWSNLMEVTY